jgi:hypothetical protein
MVLVSFDLRVKSFVLGYLDGDAFFIIVRDPIFAFVHKRNLSKVVSLFNPFINALIFSELFADLLI